jgi:hypothetical protein
MAVFEQLGDTETMGVMGGGMATTTKLKIEGLVQGGVRGGEVGKEGRVLVGRAIRKRVGV